MVALRRGDQSGARLQMEREREKNEDEVVAQFERWADNPQVRDWIGQDWVSPAERRRRLREILGLPAESPETTAPATPESNPIKSGQTGGTHFCPGDAGA